MHSVSFLQMHSVDDDNDNDEMHAKVTSHETDFCAFHDKVVSFGLMLQQKSVR